jgi:hypothetical protein
MSRDNTVIPFRQPEVIDDPLSEVAREAAPTLRTGAQRATRIMWSWRVSAE